MGFGHVPDWSVLVNLMRILSKNVLNLQLQSIIKIFEKSNLIED